MTELHYYGIEIEFNTKLLNNQAADAYLEDYEMICRDYVKEGLKNIDGVAISIHQGETIRYCNLSIISLEPIERTDIKAIENLFNNKFPLQPVIVTLSFLS
uniref:hypothetical protein n=1 Tax=Streptococcus pluranimalium TaxID=82348 RepID=UPI003F690EE6